MALPHAKESQPFYRTAKQRFTDAMFLLDNDRTTGAVYLAGYGVECMLKALVLSIAPRTRRAKIVASFRGARAHDFEWLQRLYRDLGGPTFPQDIRERFVHVATWTTDFRYRPGMIEHADAIEFLDAAKAIIKWADGRM
jgi:HEPN domain-containing protein